MIDIAELDPSFWEETLCKPDAFVWWYVDLRSEEGTGLVLLWGIGIPFVRAAGAERSGALQLVFYERGRAEYYHLGTIENFVALRADGSADFSGGKIEVSSGPREVRLSASLDLESPFSDGVRLDLELVGTPFEAERSSSSEHRWAPRSLVAEAKARLRFAEREVELVGGAYFDSNASRVPLFEQGFRAWRWGRITFPEGCYVFYEVLREAGKEGDSLLFCARPGGKSEPCDGLSWERGVRALYGLVTPRRGTIRSNEGEIHFESEALVDDGPFYQRHLLRGRNSKGEIGLGFYEVVSVEKLGVGWHAPFVNMRIMRHEPGANSFWLPLFRGERSGRFRRLLRNIFSSPRGGTGA